MSVPEVCSTTFIAVPNRQTVDDERALAAQIESQLANAPIYWDMVLRRTVTVEHRGVVVVRLYATIRGTANQVKGELDAWLCSQGYTLVTILPPVIDAPPPKPAAPSPRKQSDDPAVKRELIVGVLLGVSSYRSTLAYLCRELNDTADALLLAIQQLVREGMVERFGIAPSRPGVNLTMRVIYGLTGLGARIGNKYRPSDPGEGWGKKVSPIRTAVLHVLVAAHPRQTPAQSIITQVSIGTSGSISHVLNHGFTVGYIGRTKIGKSVLYVLTDVGLPAAKEYLASQGP